VADFRPSQVTGNLNVSGTVDLSRLDLVRYAEALLVPSSIETTVLTFTATQTTNISLITVSGQGYAKFKLYIDANQIGTKISGPDRGVEWNFSFPLALDIGSVLTIKVTHYSTGDALDFYGGMYAFTSV